MTTNSCKSQAKMQEYLSKLAKDLAYTDEEIAAGIEYADRAKRRSHPPGEWDKAGRFYAQEHTNSVLSCRSPSRAWPHSQLIAPKSIWQTIRHMSAAFVRLTISSLMTSTTTRLSAFSRKGFVSAKLTGGARRKHRHAGGLRFWRYGLIACITVSRSCRISPTLRSPIAASQAKLSSTGRCA
jgi:hypothetical protein